MANCGGAGDCSADLFCAQEWWAWERGRETERESHCTPSLGLNFSSSAAGLQVQPDWISVGVNGKPRRGEVAKLRMVWIKPLATCNLTLCQWLQTFLEQSHWTPHFQTWLVDSAFLLKMCLFFYARQTALREPCFAYAGKSNPFHAAVTFGLLGPIVLLPQ